MTLDECLAALADIETVLPREPMQWALDHWDEAGPRFTAMLDAYARGEDRSDAAGSILFLAMHMQAERSDTSAFGPLCRLLRDAGAASNVLGDAITETLGRVLVNTYDGDLPALASVVEEEGDEDFIRDAALHAMAYLARTGRIAEADMRAHLVRWLDDLQPQHENIIWEAWAMAVAYLGYADLAGRVEELFRKEFIDHYAMSLKDFQKELRRTLDDPARMDGFFAAGTGPFGSAVEELEGWVSYGGTEAGLPGGERDREPFLDRDWEPPMLPVINPLRGVGRNDPCPCGSGKKYKKCCLV